MQAETRRHAPMLPASRLPGFLSYLDAALESRWLRVALIAVAVVFLIIRFVHLSDDFPYFSPWVQDQAKFTDEGWWAAAAVRHVLTGHWSVAGDYNPAAALPVWPFLLAGVFHFTGVSLVGARALNVVISSATLPLAYVLVRRYSSSTSHFPATLGALMLATSPFAFFFSRLAILETLVVFEFCALLLVASFVAHRRIWPWIALAALTTAMLLTKTTAALLLPAVLWLAWCATERKLRGLIRAVLAVALLPAVLVKSYAGLVSRMGYGEDYRYFFDVNSMPDFDWHVLLAGAHELLLSGFWVDRVLYPLGFAILVAALVWKRSLWRNPLFAASWLAIGVQGLFIVRRVDDYAPRYYLVMVLPIILIVVVTFGELKSNARKVALALLVVIAATITTDGILIRHFMTHRDYDFRDAAVAIAEIIRSRPEQSQLMLGVSAPQISLMTGIPAINDFYGTQDGAEKLARNQPGWYLAWNRIDPDNEAMLAGYELEKMGSYDAFDDDERTTLILYKMVRRAGVSAAGAQASRP